MSGMGEMVRFSNGGETYEGYLAPSATGAGPGVIVIQEWWGLVGHIKDVADRFAKEGFTALAPDLYRGKTTTEPDDAATLMQALNIAETGVILDKAIATLAERSTTQPGDKIGVVGFCMGGQLAIFAAGANPLIRAAVDFYGIHPKVSPNYEAFNGPVLGFFAEHDEYAGPVAAKALDEELTRFDVPHEFKIYAGAHHAFFNDARPTVYDAEAAADAWSRTIAFLRKELSS
jgi:carboxymethylenebutenolidase